VRRADHSSRRVIAIVVFLDEWDREASIMRRPRPTGGYYAMPQKKKVFSELK
jgi:hypothetical protein